jgi:hypothetical protein
MRKNIYTLFAAVSMLLGITAANAQAPVIVYFTVDMSAANLGECATSTTNPCPNGITCQIIPFDPTLDVVEPMGGEYNGWSAPETVADCGLPFTPGPQDMVPVSPGSLIYTISDDTLKPDANGFTTFKFRIDHTWDNDEIRGVGDGNRHAKLPAGATSVLISCVFDDTTGMTASDVSGISNPTLATIQKIYPNPASDVTRIAYNVLEPGNVQVYVSDAIGRKVIAVAAGKQSFGTHESSVDVSSLTNGIYFVTVQVGNSTVTQKLTVAH